MQHFYVLNLHKRKKWLLLSFFILIIIGFFLIFTPTRIVSLFIQNQQAAVTKGSSSEKQVALTFNISWGEEKVHDILTVLKEEEVRATFFLSGEWAERHPQIVEKIITDKHEIGSLGYRYKSYLEQDREDIRKDMTKANAVFKKMDLDSITYIRPPSGHFNKDIIDLAEDLALQTVHWSVNPDDWKNPGTDVITTHLKENITNGDIVLLHASDVAKQTEEALRQVIPYLKEENYHLSTISELLYHVQTEEENVE